MNDVLTNDTKANIIFLSGFAFEDALVGISEDNRAIYEYDKMIDCLVQNEGFSEDEATEWIECNTLPAISCIGHGAPIIMHAI